MTARERNRRDAEIVAMRDAGVPAQEIAIRVGLSKRQCDRIIVARRRERARHRVAVRESATPHELLDSLEELYHGSVELGKSTGRLSHYLRLKWDEILWDERRAALENVIDEAMAREAKMALKGEA